MDAMTTDEQFKAGEVMAVAMHDEPNISSEPSITTEEDHGIILPVPPPPPAAAQNKRIPRGAKRSQYDKTIKVNMDELPSVDTLQKQHRKKFWEDMVLILIIIVCFLALTAILIMYLK